MLEYDCEMLIFNTSEHQITMLPEMLNKRAADGWRLFQIIDLRRNGFHLLVFERQK